MSRSAEDQRAARRADPERFARYERTKRERHGAKLDAASRERKKRWRLSNPEKARAGDKRCNDRRVQAKGAALAQKYRDDPEHCLIVRLRVRTAKALSGRSKTLATRELVGCTTEDLRAWIEGQFRGGMSWDNRSRWEIDHHWPLSAFDLSDTRHLAKACHYTNLRPLWRTENRAKKDRMSPEDRAAFDAWKASLDA